MKITYRQLNMHGNPGVLPAFQAFATLSKLGVRMPEGADVWDAKERCQAASTAFQALYQGLVEKHGKKDKGKLVQNRIENGFISYQIKDVKAMNAETTALLDKEIDVEFNPIPLDALKGTTLPPEVFGSISWFFIREPQE